MWTKALAFIGGNPLYFIIGAAVLATACFGAGFYSATSLCEGRLVKELASAAGEAKAATEKAVLKAVAEQREAGNRALKDLQDKQAKTAAKVKIVTKVIHDRVPDVAGCKVPEDVMRQIDEVGR